MAALNPPLYNANHPPPPSQPLHPPPAVHAAKRLVRKEGGRGKTARDKKELQGRER